MNTDIASATTVAGQTWNAARYAHNAGFVPTLGAPVAELLAAQAGERILDLGCGDGVLTAQLAASGAQVIGVDASPDLVAAAVERGVDARVMDGHALTFHHAFDAVFSNAALHWMRQPEAVLSGVQRALKPGGRFVGEFGGHGNVAAIVTALRASLCAHDAGEPTFAWFFPTADEYAALLAEHRFHVEQIALIPRPTPLPTGIAGWLRTFADPFLADVEAHVRRRVLEDTETLLRPALCDQRGQWHADYVRLRFVARTSTPSDFKQGNPQ
ncbi:Trans-aconitate methyltransferase [Pseudoxanthomonas sp. GM95]|uniref:class I SAM-dependent methyltransferase n=1 Tax=Pseudoxanthomonas sp. GM95 TaxID=1881043 RepID=UPI0008CF027E|nr:class I SAM-dependent methyltransferase [Pseudoxanthomonas sp. GM95]SEL62351.1 Trans-aconitate methyltransferase [Pseudoxanthomonas sp. GM95]